METVRTSGAAALRRGERLLESIRALPGTAVVAYDRELRYVSVEGTALESRGWTADDFQGRIADVLPARGYEQLVEPFTAALEGETRQFEYVTADGQGVYWGHVAPVFDETGGVIVGGVAVFHDVTSSTQAHRELALAHDLALAIGRTATVESAFTTMLRTLCEADGWALGQVWTPTDDGSRLACAPSWWSTTPGLDAFRTASRALLIDVGAGLPGLVWHTRRASWVSDLAAAPELLRAGVAAEVGLSSALAVPVLANDEPLAVIELFSAEPRTQDTLFLQVVSTVAAQIGALIQRKRAEQARREPEERYRTIVHTANEGVWVFDTNGLTSFVNPKLATLLGYDPTEIAGRPFSDFVDPVRRGNGSAATLDPPGHQGDVPFRRKDGTELWGLVATNPISDAHGRPAGTLAMVTDITERRRAEDRLRQREAQLADAQQLAHIGSWEWDIATDRVTWSDEMCRIFGVAANGFGGGYEEYLRRVHPDDRTTVDIVIKRAFERGHGFAFEHRIVRDDGEVRVLQAHGEVVCGADGNSTSMYGTAQDITERKAAESRLQHLADHDPLTGLLNRRRFTEEVGRQLAFAARYGQPGAVLMLDLDHFKYVNDALGHAAGDELIRSVAQTLAGRLRTSDTLARLGGDEFAVLLPAAEVEDAHAVARDLIESVRRPVVDHERAIHLSTSIGIAPFDGGRAVTADELLVEADIAMYEAKERGRNQSADYAPEDDHSAGMQARVTWSTRIREALDHDRFVLHAQPILDLRTGRPALYELLLRMRGEDGELFRPRSFLYVAERFGLMGLIDRWVVANAVRLLSEPALREGAQRVSINISAGSLGDDDLPRFIQWELTQRAVDPRRLVLEVTETAAITSIGQAAAFIERLSDLGVGFALDDFGTGFGTFYYLKHLAFDYLKIDGEFIRGLADCPTDQLVVKALVQTAKGLGTKTIAEFVGEDRTVSLLREYGVDYAQGHHLGAPAPLEELLDPAA